MSSTSTKWEKTDLRKLRKVLAEVMAASQPIPPLCEFIRETRNRLELSQEEAARRLHLSIAGYLAYERFREPKPSRLREIARAFGLEEDYFLRGRGLSAARDAVDTASERHDELIARLERIEEALRVLHVRRSA